MMTFLSNCLRSGFASPGAAGALAVVLALIGLSALIHSATPVRRHGPSYRLQPSLWIAEECLCLIGLLTLFVVAVVMVCRG